MGVGSLFGELHPDSVGGNGTIVHGPSRQARGTVWRSAVCEDSLGGWFPYSF
jgi:hypothetical protein